MHGRIAQSGSSLSTGDLRVLIYDANVNGNLVYDSGSDFNNAINDGVVDVLLGSSTQLDLNYGGYYYMDLSINGTDLDFNGSERKQFESSHGVVKTGSILDATITNSDISTTAGIDWAKISKTGADLNALKWGSDFNNIYARRGSDVNVTGAWNFANNTTYGGGFGSGGITIQNGVLYTQSLVILNDLNAATVTAIDVNGNYTPFLDATWSLGSSSNRWLGIFTRDLNATDINSTRASIGTLSLPITSGRIPFSDGTNITSDGNLYWDNSNKRLGVGTSSPSSILTLLGNNSLTFSGVSAQDQASTISTDSSDNLIINFGGGSGKVLQIKASGSTFLQLAHPSGTSPHSLSGGLTLTSGATTSKPLVVRGISSSQSANLQEWQNSDTTVLAAITPDGNLGINTSTPTQKLDVNGNARILGDLNVTGTSYLGSIILNTTDLNVTNINPRDQNIIFNNTSGGEIARIVGAGGTSGYIGIGTTLPTALLSIANNSTIRMGASYVSDNGGLDITSRSGGEGGIIRFYHNRVNDGGSGRATIDAASSVGFRISTTSWGNLMLGSDNSIIFGSSASVNTVSEYARFTSDGNLGLKDTTPDALLDVNGVNLNSDVFRVDANGNSSPVSFVIDKNGNVGIGKSAPTVYLDIVGGFIVTGRDLGVSNFDNWSLTGGHNGNGKINSVTNGGSGNSGGVNVPAGSLGVGYTMSSGSGPAWAHTAQFAVRGRSVLQLTTGDYIAITDQASDAGNDLIRITADGNLGIGTSTPKNKLNIVGDTNLSGNLIFNNNTDHNIWMPSSSLATSYSLTISSSSSESGNVNGGALSLYSGNPTGTGAGGQIIIKSGSSPGGGRGGDINLSAGLGGGNGASSDGSILGGTLYLNGGHTLAAGPTVAGGVVIAGGNSANSRGGTIIINPGSGSSASADGNIVLANLRGMVGLGTASPANKLNIVGDVNVFDGNIIVGKANNAMQFRSDGSASQCAGLAKLASGAVTVTTSCMSDNNAMVLITGQTQGSGMGGLRVTSKTTSAFTISSTNASDDADVYWRIEKVLN